MPITVRINVRSGIQAYGLRSELIAYTRAHLNGRPSQGITAHFQILSNEKNMKGVVAADGAVMPSLIDQAFIDKFLQMK